VEAAPKVSADHIDKADPHSERKLAELYEQVGRLMVETRFFVAQVRALRRARRLMMVQAGAQLSLRRQCVLLGLSRAALYYRPVKAESYALELIALIDRHTCAPRFRGRGGRRSGFMRRATWSIASGGAT
jgi:putative transposase